MMENPKIVFENAEEIKLRIWLQSNYTERFKKLMRLRKINKMIKGAKIKHSN